METMLDNMYKIIYTSYLLNSDVEKCRCLPILKGTIHEKRGLQDFYPEDQEVIVEADQVLPFLTEAERIKIQKDTL